MKSVSEECLTALDLFGLGASVSECRRMGCGHINATYFVQAAEGKFSLQKLDTDIFHDIDGMMNNIVGVTGHIIKKGGCSIAPVRSKKGDYYVVTEEGTYRLMTYVEGDIKEKITSPSDMETVGSGFGTFLAALQDYNGKLAVTIPDFHNTPKRYADLVRAAQKDSDRRKNAAELLDGYFGYKRLCDAVEQPLRQGKIPYRVTHNDTKINNLVIKNNRPLCVIDLDTVMPGSICYDFGDAIRSGGSTSPEDSPEIEKTRADLEAYEAFCKGFLIKELHVTDGERRLLPISAFLYTYECGMRFLTDYLSYDVYFGAKYPEHNLVRAKNQFVLAEDLLKKLDELTRITDAFF